MAAEVWAILTAICWAVGSYFEKKGVHAGGYAPVIGAGIRTIVSAVLLGIFSYPYWHQVRASGVKPIAMIAVSGGIFSGTLGIMFLYFALSRGNLSVVMPVAFCLTPVLGTVLGVMFMHEKINYLQILGILLTVSGATLTVYFKGR